MQIIGLLLALFLISCHNENSKDKNNFIKVNIDSLSSNEPIYFSKIFSNFKIIPLETSTESVINRIQNIKYHNNRFYVFDGFNLKTIFIFSKDGKYINKICAIGKGIGEYLNPINFDIDIKNQNILLFDWNSQKLNIYDLNGNFKESVNIKNRFTSFTYSENKIYFFRTNPQNINDKKACLFYKYNTNGSVLAKYFDFMEYSYGLRLNNVSPRGNFFVSKNDIKLFMPLCDTIFSISDEKIQPFIVLNSNKFKLNKKDLIDLKKGSKTSSILKLQELNKLYNIRDYAEFNNNIFFKFNIGHKQFIIFYNLPTGSVTCSSKRIDDLTYISPDIFMINNYQFASILTPEMIPKFKEGVIAGKIKLSNTDKELILKNSEFDNPIIILYDVE